MPFKIAKEITESFFANLTPLTPIDERPEKILKSLQPNLIHFPSLVDIKILSFSEQIITFTNSSLSLSFIAIFPLALIL